MYLRLTPFRLAAACAALVLLTGCSLLRFTVSTGETPLSPEDSRMRQLTRGFYYEAADELTAAADSIAAAADDPAVRLRTLGWKIRSTRAAVDAVMQQSPELALLDTWLLYRNLDSLLAARPDSLLFGAESYRARRVAARLHRKARHLAGELLAPERLALMERFVAARPLPSPDEEVAADRTMLAWSDFLADNGVEASYPVGTMAEVMADMGDRAGGAARQMVRTLDWTGEMLALRVAQDSVRDRLAAQLDSLERDFGRLTAVAEDLPGLSREVTASFTAELNDALREALDAFDRSVDHAFRSVDRQREALQRYVTAEREALIAQAQQAADEAVARTLDRLPGLLGRVVVWIVLFVALLVGVPFALGLWLGGLRRRAREARGGDPGGRGPAAPSASPAEGPKRVS